MTISQVISTTSPITIQGYAGFEVIDGAIYYHTYQNVTGTWGVYSLVEGQEPVLIDVDEQFNGFFKLDNTLYAIYNQGIREYINGEFSEIQISTGGMSIYSSTYSVYQDKLYVRDQSGSPYNLFVGSIN